MEIELLLDAPPCLVANKPGGILTQAVPGVPSFENCIRDYLQVRAESAGEPMTGEKIYVGVPHRLDRPVSGAILFCRSARATRRVSEQFAGRMVEKKYWALVEGQVHPEQGTWIDWMRKIPDEPRAELLASDHPQARQAVLHYRVMRHDDFGSWLEIELETGRMHQIRLQCSSRGHSILGDEQYGATVPFGPETDDVRGRWIALHARRLSFEHPHSHERLSVEAPLWSSWLALRPPNYWYA